MFSRFFIDRPVFAIVISLFIALAGLAAMRVLPIAQYPEIAPPVVTVTAVYPGASAAVLESTVAAPIENTLNGVEDLLYISSTSASNGTVQIQVTFNIGANVDKAALNVNNRVKQVEPRLPQEVRRQGVTVGEWVAGNDWVITSGLAPGDKVIVDGLMKVYPGAQVQVGDPAAAAAGAEPAPAKK